VISRTTLLLFACLAIALSSRGEDSLLDVNKASHLTRDQQRLFGPRSGSRKYDPRMVRAAEIALQRAQPQTTWYCWRYVKDALLAANLVSSRPTTVLAKQAGDELCRKFGFKKLRIRDPEKAPIGAVLVYGGADAGHVEFRTSSGFVSDFVSRTPYRRPLLGVFVKPS